MDDDWFSLFFWLNQTIFLLRARAENVSSKVMALMLRVARIASLSARAESSLEEGTWTKKIL